MRNICLKHIENITSLIMDLDEDIKEDYYDGIIIKLDKLNNEEIRQATEQLEKWLEAS